MSAANSADWFGGHRVSAGGVASLSPPIDPAVMALGSTPLPKPARSGNRPRRTRGYYMAADRNRLTAGFQNQIGIGVDRPNMTDGAVIRARIYELERNNGVMDGAIRAHVTGVLPSAVIVEPNATRRREDVAGAAINRNWNDPVRAKWKRWCKGDLDFGAWGLENVDDPNSKQWLRPDQLVPVLWQALKETMARVEALERR